jgi:hypothetical protein
MYDGSPEGLTLACALHVTRVTTVLANCHIENANERLATVIEKNYDGTGLNDIAFDTKNHSVSALLHRTLTVSAINLET